ncbi:MAG: cytidine deaminase [Bacteroidales bacterium]|nr:cytidine deaminase [Bacteroidales bacterium]
MKKQLTIEFEEFEALNELCEKDYELVMEARQALQSSYSPYSKFRVGSAVRFQDGEIVKGSNQENVAYPSGMCAERVALFAAGNDAKQRKIAAIAIAAMKDGCFVAAKPCGACLQTMLETEKRAKASLTILIALGEDKFAKVEGVKNLMPFAFTDF